MAPVFEYLTPTHQSIDVVVPIAAHSRPKRMVVRVRNDGNGVDLHIAQPLESGAHPNKATAQPTLAD